MTYLLKKIKQIPITVAFSDFPNFQDSNDERSVINFIYNKFFSLYKTHVQSRNNSTKKHLLKLHMHRTCALDTDQIGKLMTDLEEDMVKQQLRDSGFV